MPWRCHQERPLVASISPVTLPSPLSWKNNCFFSIFVSVISIWLFGLILRCDNVFRYISCSITCSNLLGRCPVPFLNRSMSQTKALYISTIGFTYHLDYKVHNKYKKCLIKRKSPKSAILTIRSGPLLVSKQFLMGGKHDNASFGNTFSIFMEIHIQ